MCCSVFLEAVPQICVSVQFAESWRLEVLVLSDPSPLASASSSVGKSLRLF